MKSKPTQAHSLSEQNSTLFQKSTWRPPCRGRGANHSVPHVSGYELESLLSNRIVNTWIKSYTFWMSYIYSKKNVSYHQTFLWIHNLYKSKAIFVKNVMKSFCNSAKVWTKFVKSRINWYTFIVKGRDDSFCSKENYNKNVPTFTFFMFQWNPQNMHQKMLTVPACC